MKKLILLAVFAVVSASAFAQLSYGLKGGLNLASLSNKDLVTENGKMKPSIYVGGFAEYRFSSFIAGSVELVYSRQGISDSFDDEDFGSVKDRMRLNYLNLPILAKIYLIGDQLSLDLGPQVGFMLNAKEWMKADGETGTEDQTDLFKTVDVSAAMGLSYNIGNIILQGRYNLGLTDIVKDNDGDKKFKNGVIQLGVGYRF